MDHKTCALCLGTLNRVALTHGRPDRFEVALGIPAEGYSRSWQICDTCGSATNQHKHVTSERLAAMGTAYYEVDFAGGPLRPKFDRVMAMPASQSDNAGRVTRVLNAVGRFGPAPGGPIRLIDIGAGLGVFGARFLAEARARGRDAACTLYEPDPKAAEHLRSLDGLDIVEGLFSATTAKVGAAQVITMNKVLEHIRAPLGVLQDIAACLHPSEGFTYIEVPDVATIDTRPPEDNILGALHHHLYSPAGLGLLLRRAGLEPLLIDRIVEPSGKLSVYAFAGHSALLKRLAARIRPA